MSQHKVAIFGMGRMGKVHLKAALNIGLDIIAVCDSRESTSPEVQEILGVKSTLFFNNYHELIEQVKFDIAIVATTTPERFQILIELLNLDRELRILSEKPLASNSFDLLRLKCALKESNNKYFAVNHQMRYMQQYSEIRNLIDNGNYGKMSGMIVAASNIGLGMNVTHYFEAFRWLTSDNDISVTARIEDGVLKSPRGEMYGDFAGWAIAQNSIGQKLFIDFSSNVGHGIICTYQFEQAKIVINELEGTMIIYGRQSAYMLEPLSRYGLPGFQDYVSIDLISLEALSQRVIQSLIELKNFPTFEDGLISTSLALSALYSSNAGNMPVKWQGILEKQVSTPWA